MVPVSFVEPASCDREEDEVAITVEVGAIVGAQLCNHKPLVQEVIDREGINVVYP